MVGQFAQCMAVEPAPTGLEVASDLRMHGGCLSLWTVLIKHSLAKLVVEEVELPAAAQKVAAEGALDALCHDHGVRAEFPGKQLGQFVAGHANAAMCEVQAPPPHRIQAEHFQPLQHPPE